MSLTAHRRIAKKSSNSIRAFRERRSGSRNVIIAGSLPRTVVEDYPLACPTGRTYESHQVHQSQSIHSVPGGFLLDFPPNHTL